MKYLLLLILSFSTISNAELLNCGTKELKQVHIQGDRDDGHVHANSMVLEFKDATCNERKYAYIANDHPSYGAMVSIVLASQAQGKNLLVQVNTTKSRGSASEISIVSLAN